MARGRRIQLSKEGSTIIAIHFDGELAMFISEELGWLSVPSMESVETGLHYLQKSGFTVSDAQIALPLIALDLAEISDLRDHRDGPPIASRSLAAAVLDLRDRLEGMGLIQTGIPNPDRYMITPRMH